MPEAMQLLDKRSQSMKTSKDYTIKNYRGYGSITVPCGTKITHQTACGIDKKYHFVDDFDFLAEQYPGNTILIHDVIHYGIDVPKEYVEEEPLPS